MKMKALHISNALIATGLSFVIACSSPENDSLSIERLKTQRDSLKELKSKLSEQLSSIESQLAASDSSLQKRLSAVTVAPVQEKPFEHYFTVQGNVETDKEAMLFPEAQGRVLNISVKEGQRVAKGDVLMLLDARVLQNSISELQSRLDLAETIFEKQERLWKKNIGSEIQYLEAKNNRDALKKNLQTMNAQLEMYKVKAPFAGVVDELLPKIGEMASPMAPVARIIDVAEVYVKCDVTESYLGKIKPGDSVLIRFPALGLEYNSSISRIGQYINPANRSFSVTVKINNKNEALRPNLIAEVQIRDFAADSALVIPESLVLLNPNGDEFVFVSNAGEGLAKVEKRMIQTGISYQNEQVIERGLKAGEFIVAEGSRSIKDGEEVQIIAMEKNGR